MTISLVKKETKRNKIDLFGRIVFQVNFKLRTRPI